MEYLNPGSNFKSLNRVEILSRLNSKLLFKMTLHLHVKISARHTELKIQLGLANPRYNLNLGPKFQIFYIIDIFPNLDKNLILCTREFLIVYCLKNKDGEFTSTFQMHWWHWWLISHIKCLQEFYSSYAKFSFFIIESFQWLQGFEAIIVT